MCREELRSKVAVPASLNPLHGLLYERSVSNANYITRVFVKQLIVYLQQGCAIGYTDSYLAPNLQSASEQSQVSDTTLRDECEAEQILGPFGQPPFANFYRGFITSCNTRERKTVKCCRAS